MKSILAALALLVAVALFPAAPATACNAVGVATPAFSLTAPVYASQAIVQPVYAQPVYAESFLAQPFLQIAVGGYGQAFRQREVVQRVVVPRQRVVVGRQRVVVGH